MTTAEPFEDGGSRARLSFTHDLACRVRREQRATWLQRLVSALVTYLAVPITRAGHVARPCAPPHRCLRPANCASVRGAQLDGLRLLADRAHRLLRAHRRLLRPHVPARGAGTRIRPYVATGLLLAVVVIAASMWAAHTVVTGGYDLLGLQVQGPDLYRLIAPACATGLALLVLATVNVLALFGVSLLYLVIAVGRVDLGWTIDRNSRWASAPHLVSRPRCRCSQRSGSQRANDQTDTWTSAPK